MYFAPLDALAVYKLRWYIEVCCHEYKQNQDLPDVMRNILLMNSTTHHTLRVGGLCDSTKSTAKAPIPHWPLPCI